MKQTYLTCPPSEGGRRISINLSRRDFDLTQVPQKGEEKTGKKKKVDPEHYTLLGFDTEYQTEKLEQEKMSDEERAATRKRLEAGDIFHEVLSYQFATSIVSRFTDFEDGEVCNSRGILLPEGSSLEERFYLEEFVNAALSELKASMDDTHQIPTVIYLIGHFTRADIPMFKDFRDDKQRNTLNLTNVRNTFTSTAASIYINLPVSDGEVRLRVMLRDTFLLAPQGKKSLRDVGETIGEFKTELETHQIENMKPLMETDWEKFKEYAIQDAYVCMSYGHKILKLNHKQTGGFKLPVTLTAMGVKLLEKMWKEEGRDRLQILGKERLLDGSFNKKKQQFFYKQKDVFKDKVFWRVNFITEGYHGGRNEQFCFGVSDEGEWFDYDLKAAYPTAMNLIGYPDWDAIRFVDTVEELLNYPAYSLTFASVRFKFPDEVRYPTLPVRTLNGIVFPRAGISNCSIPEILLANELGAKITELREGVHVPTDDSNRIFQPYLKHCLAKRREHSDKTSLDNLFWKELVNATYGKTAQGLRERRVFDLRDRETIKLGDSRITNPFFASYITSFVRGVLGEVMNKLPDGIDVFSVTTDGFLTNAKKEDIDIASQGVLRRLYGKSREELVGEDDTFEIKHKARQLLGWRTRGQATIQPSDFYTGSPKETDNNLVLAKAGINLPRGLNKKQENEEILKKFFNRTPDSLIHVHTSIGVREQWVLGEGQDLVDAYIQRRLSMEYDWKRKPIKWEMRDVEVNGEKHSHLFFKTAPWERMEDFQKVRRELNDFLRDKKDKNVVFKTTQDLEVFQKYVMIKHSRRIDFDRDAGETRSYNWREGVNGDLRILKRELICAFKEHAAGFDYIVADTEDGNGKIVRREGGANYKKIMVKGWQWRNLLNDIFEENDFRKDDGEPLVSITDINQRQRSFQYQNVPPTPEVMKVLHTLKERAVPNLQIEDIVTNNEAWDWVLEKDEAISGEQVTH